MRTILLLTVSNVFMVVAWYGHLKYKESPLWIAILASWGIAFVEYCFQVPANRWGHGQFTAAQLRIIAEVLNLVIFAVFSVLYLREEFRWNYAVGFALLIAAVAVMFIGRDAPASAQPPAKTPPGTVLVQGGTAPALARIEPRLDERAAGPQQP